MTNALSGRSLRSARPTNAGSPPNFTKNDRRPNQYDRNNVQVGDFWMYSDPTPGTNYNELYCLLSLKGDSVSAGELADWNLVTSGSAGNISSILTDTGVVIPDVNGQVQLLAGENTNTQVGSTTSEVLVNLNRTIRWPATNASGTEGVIYLDGHRFLHAYNSSGDVEQGNVFLGASSGNLTLTGGSNVCVGLGTGLHLTTGQANCVLGTQALQGLTSGSQNIAVGKFSLFNLISGDDNTSIGDHALSGLTTGSRNIAVGLEAGTLLTTTDSDNICIGNTGNSGSDGVMQIGTEGTHVETYISGIYGVNLNNVAHPGGHGGYVVAATDEGQIGEIRLLSSNGSVDIDTSVPGEYDFTVAGGGGGSTTPVSFSAVQVTDTANLVDGATYNMGSGVALTELFDIGNNFNPGNGAGTGCSFTAPVTGKYYFEFYANTNSSAVASITAIIVTGTSAKTYQFQGSLAGGGLVSAQTAVVAMTATDVATFTIVGNGGGHWNVIGNGTSNNLNSTRISGFLLTGSNDPIQILGADVGSATGTTVNIVGGNNISTAGAADTITVNVSGTTNHAVQVGNNTNSLTSLALGTAGQVLTSNGAGSNPSWQDNSAAFSQPFLYYYAANNTPGAFVGLRTFNLGSLGGFGLTMLYDQGTSFNGGNGAGTGATFTAPATGVYNFTFQTYTNTPSLVQLFFSSVNYAAIKISRFDSFYFTNVTSTSQQRTYVSTVYLTIGQVVTWECTQSNDSGGTSSFIGGLNPVSLASGITYISGYRIS